MITDRHTEKWTFVNVDLLSRLKRLLQEDEGDKLARDANMAVLKAKTGNHQVKQRQEWYI